MKRHLQTGRVSFLLFSLCPQIIRLQKNPSVPTCEYICFRLLGLFREDAWLYPDKPALPPSRDNGWGCAMRLLPTAAMSHHGSLFSTVTLRASVVMFWQSYCSHIVKPQHSFSCRTGRQKTRVCKRCETMKCSEFKCGPVFQRHRVRIL